MKNADVVTHYMRERLTISPSSPDNGLTGGRKTRIHRLRLHSGRLGIWLVAFWKYQPGNSGLQVKEAELVAVGQSRHKISGGCIFFLYHALNVTSPTWNEYGSIRGALAGGVDTCFLVIGSHQPLPWSGTFLH